MRKTPALGKIYLMAAAFFMLLPSLLNLYTGETGNLIVASGKMSDPNFDETAVYMFDHKYDHAFGLVINRLIPKQDRARIPAFLRDKDIPVFYGGPAGYPETVAILERVQDKDGSTYLKYLAFDEAIRENPDFLTQVVKSIQSGEDRYRVYVGFSGWGLLQLEREFGSGVWASTSLDPDWLDYKDLSQKDVWLKALERADAKRKPRNPGTI